MGEKSAARCASKARDPAHLSVLRCPLRLRFPSPAPNTKTVVGQANQHLLLLKHPANPSPAGGSRLAKRRARSARSLGQGISAQCRRPNVEPVLDPVELVCVDVVLAHLFGKDAVHQLELCNEHRNLEPRVAFDG